MFLLRTAIAPFALPLVLSASPFSLLLSNVRSPSPDRLRRRPWIFPPVLSATPTMLRLADVAGDRQVESNDTEIRGRETGKEEDRNP